MNNPKPLPASQGLFFEDYEVGQSVTSVGRTVTEADVVGFAALSGDWNPIHTDREFAAKSPYEQRVAHGLLGVSIAVALAVRLGFLEETLIAFREIDEWKFSQPIFIGDTVRVRLEITETRAVRRLNGGMVTIQAEILNQSDTVVQRGLWRVLIKSREGAA